MSDIVSDQPEGSARRPLSGDMPLCSVIVPVFNEAGNIAPMHEALCALASREPWCEWEFLFVEDGSSDGTYRALKDRHAADPRVKAIRLSRNYGSHTAAAAGLAFASGDAAVIMAGDLQDHPREISRLLEEWKAGSEVVFAVRASRADSFMTRTLSRMFARLVRRIAIPNYPLDGTGSFCLLDRKVIDALNSFPERNRMTFGLILTAGFETKYITYNRGDRFSGSSKWTFRKKIRHLFDTVLSFSFVPIRTASLAGALISLVGFIYAFYLALNAMIYGTPVQGWTSVVVLILMFGGLQLIVMGMLGEYIWRICDEVRARPLFLVSELVGDYPLVRRQQAEPPRLPVAPYKSLPHGQDHTAGG